VRDILSVPRDEAESESGPVDELDQVGEPYIDFGKPVTQLPAVLIAEERSVTVAAQNTQV
jgi:hypothetical protein